MKGPSFYFQKMSLTRQILSIILTVLMFFIMFFFVFVIMLGFFFFFQAEDGIRDRVM